MPEQMIMPPLDAVFDYIRLLDPVKKEVKYYLKPEWPADREDLDACFCFWGKSTACDNCVSTRALHQNKTIVKIEYKGGRVFMVMSVPRPEQGKTVVVEMLKDITDSGLIDIEGREVSEIRALVDARNDGVIRDALTGVYNEAFLYERLPYSILLAEREQRALALIYVSIRNYPGLSARQGGGQVNGVMIKVAKILRRFCRKQEDWAARLGSAGFVLVLPGRNDADAYRTCKRISDALARAEIEAGVGCYVMAEEIVTAEELIRLAGSRIDLGRENSPGSLHLPLYLLTAREMEIAGLLQQGLSNKEIGGRLFISDPTVKKHLSAIYAKAGVASRTEFIVRFGKIKMD